MNSKTPYDEKPLYLYIAHQSVHSPVGPAPAGEPCESHRVGTNSFHFYCFTNGKFISRCNRRFLASRHGVVVTTHCVSLMWEYIDHRPTIGIFIVENIYPLHHCLRFPIEIFMSVCLFLCLSLPLSVPLYLCVPVPLLLCRCACVSLSPCLSV